MRQFIVGFVAILFLVLIYRAYILNKPCEHKLKPVDEKNRIKISVEQVSRFRKSLTFATVSYKENSQNVTALLEYISFIRDEFADIEQHKFVKFQTINNLSMLYEIEGTEKNLKPYLFAAHSDVVPANAENDRWTHPPFSGSLGQDGFVYGRGALDVKSSMLGHLEAVREFLKRYGQPKRTLFLAYGHDEEIHGFNGAKFIVDHLAKINIEFEYVIDEGSMIITDFLPELKRPIALISIADKGYMTVKFFANTTGGHSSMPNKENSAICILSEAIHKLNKNPMASLLGQGPEKQTFEMLATHLGFTKRIALSNSWLFKPIIEYVFSLKASTDAFQRTTTAVTIMTSGVKDNVIPAYGEFVVNHRIHSKQSCAEALKHDLDTIGDPRVQYQVLFCIEPTAISSTTSLGYQMIEHATLQVFPDSIPIPSVMLAMSDSRFYERVSRNIYKYLPFKITNEDLKRFHGLDERISVKSYEDLINFYFLLIENTDQAHLSDDANRKHNEL